MARSSPRGLPLVSAWELVTTELGDAEAGWRRCS